MVNKMRYHCDGYTEQYLSSGTVTVAYNPEDVTSVWLLDNGAYIEFMIIESEFEGKGLDSVRELQNICRNVVKKEEKANLQAQIDLAGHIEIISNLSGEHTNLQLKNIRGTRKREQMKDHRDYMKEGKKHE